MSLLKPIWSSLFSEKPMFCFGSTSRAYLPGVEASYVFGGQPRIVPIPFPLILNTSQILCPKMNRSTTGMLHITGMGLLQMKNSGCCCIPSYPMTESWPVRLEPCCWNCRWAADDLEDPRWFFFSLGWWLEVMALKLRLRWLFDVCVKMSAVPSVFGHVNGKNDQRGAIASIYSPTALRGLSPDKGSLQLPVRVPGRFQDVLEVLVRSFWKFQWLPVWLRDGSGGLGVVPGAMCCFSCGIGSRRPSRCSPVPTP